MDSTDQTDDFCRIFELIDAIILSIKREEYSQLKGLGDQLLAIYHHPNLPRFVLKNGNALHWGYTAIGHFELSNGNVRGAVVALQKAIDVPPSPQLVSFGPTMTLAQRMLKHGENATVISYLETCKPLWKIGSKRIDIWIAEIAEGKTPDLSEVF